MSRAPQALVNPAQSPADSAASAAWQCGGCSYIYEPSQGCEQDHVPPGTSWDELPPDWRCPDCGASKSDFLLLSF